MRFTVKSGLFAAVLASSSALAHMQMSYPPILNGKYNSLIPNENKDWNPQNPLEPDGSNFPCRGWIGKDKNNVATFQAGQTMNFSLIGTTPDAYVPHGGGSCQVALSYDSGKTWSAIWSYMGGCVLDKTTYDVIIPPEAPSGEVLFAWDWFNLQGNREMYQNCALVTIAGGGAGLNDKKAFPPPFVANVGNGCATIEGQNVVFPSPGKNVFYGGVYASTRPNTPTGFTGSNCVPAGQQDAGGYDGTPGPAPAPSPSASAPVPSGSSPIPSVNPPTPTGASTQVLMAPPSSSTGSTASVSANTPAGSPSPANSPLPTPSKVCRRRKRHVVKKAASVNNGVSDRSEPVMAFADGNIFAHHHRGIERRHERLVRRRVAALPAGRPGAL